LLLDALLLKTLEIPAAIFERLEPLTGEASLCRY